MRSSIKYLFYVIIAWSCLYILLFIVDSIIGFRILNRLVVLSADGIIGDPVRTYLDRMHLHAFLLIVGLLWVVGEKINKCRNFLKYNNIKTCFLYWVLIMAMVLLERSLLDTSLYRALYWEDGFSEYGCFLILSISSILIFRVIKVSKKMKMPNWCRIYLYFLALILLLVAFEEISWGQRIFEITTPEILKEVNYQNEITMHNVFSFTWGSFIYFCFAVILSLIIIGSFFVSEYIENRYILIFIQPFKYYILIAPILPLIILRDEVFEEVVTLLFFLYAVQLLRQFRSLTRAT